MTLQTVLALPEDEIDTFTYYKNPFSTDPLATNFSGINYLQIMPDPIKQGTFTGYHPNYTFPAIAIVNGEAVVNRGRCVVCGMNTLY